MKVPAKKTQWYATRNFEYPKSLAVRNQIRTGTNVPFEDRGELVEVAADSQVIEIPNDLREGWIKRGLIVEVKVEEESTNDTER